MAARDERERQNDSCQVISSKGPAGVLTQAPVILVDRSSAARNRSTWTGALGLALLGSAAFAGACVGDLGDAEDHTDSVPAAVCHGQLSPGRSPIRRLTRFEYNNTVRDLLGVTNQPADVLPAEEEALGFANNASALNVTPVLAEKYMTLSETISQEVTTDPEALTGCTPEGGRAGALEDCMRSFITTFGRKAFRRPITTEEVDDFMTVFDSAGGIYADTEDPVNTAFREGVAMVLEGFLQAPAFLYRVELSEGTLPFDTEEGLLVSPLTSWEMASRLSYFLWGTMPDEELFTAAEEDKLQSKSEIATQARRMVSDPRARDAVGTFHQQWLDYDRINNVTKDPAMFPEWSPAIGAMMQEEMQQFIDGVVFDGSGDFGTLLTADFTYANDELAAFYGASAAGDDFERVDLDPEKHAGLLSMGAILGYYSHTNQTSPVHRGKLVREVLLCDVLQPPPPDIDFDVPEPAADATTRERFAQHSESAACSPCHNLMDPIGFGFEQFDALGRYRTHEENGLLIDASGSIIDSDIDGTFVGLRGLSKKLATSTEVKECYAKMWFRFAYGRGESDEDVCSVEDVNRVFEDSGGNVKELLVALTQTDAFLFKLAGDAQ